LFTSRYENDRILLAAIEEADEADLPPGWDVGPAARSHFATLLQHEDSLLR
jgi:hypothetical protein